MARLCPSLPPRAALAAGDHAELDLLETLERGLPDAFTLFHSLDFGQADTFRALEVQAVQAMERAAPDLDLLVIDELQDMQPAWVQALLGRAKGAGRVVLMEDPEQALYTDREPFEVADAVTVVSQENYRSPRALVGLINLMGLTANAVVALSPHRGETVDPLVYDAPERIAAPTVTAVERCLARGFALADIAIVSLKGRERSVLQQLDRLGPWSLSRYTGRFDEGGSTIWTPGDLLIDSVRRFKGQSAAAVVLTECDLPVLDQLGRRLLFVGLTRARCDQWRQMCLCRWRFPTVMMLPSELP